ncbi:hypothetical protein [Novosphingobium terrae]|uniref:hypothetical protein n=1 Tax=Novosphingobium terrae TaxID=2726189 RepID=UPI001980BE31|nr:hypothetical protein [Novosphingobium terrae]
MKFRLIAIMCPLAFMAGTAAYAQSSAPDAAPAKPAVKEKKICRQDDDTGSIVPKRTCHTKAEWAAIEAAAANSTNVEALRRNRLQ